MRQEDVEPYGLTWKGLQRIEYGQVDPKLSTLLTLADAFGVSVAELLRGVVPARPARRRR